MIKAFSNVADVEVSFKEYKNYTSLIADFNDGNVDLFFNTSTKSDFKVDFENTVSVYDEKAVVGLSPIS